LIQGATLEAVQFIFSGVIEATREVEDRRKLKVGKLGPGDSSGLLLGLYSKDLEPILQSRPELVELLSHSVSKLQQFLAMFDQAAIQPAPMSQPDLLWHIRKFFQLGVGRDLN
jgi:CRP-like cAMP-binding protein